MVPTRFGAVKAVLVLVGSHSLGLVAVTCPGGQSWGLQRAAWAIAFVEKLVLSPWCSCLGAGQALACRLWRNRLGLVQIL